MKHEPLLLPLGQAAYAIIGWAGGISRGSQGPCHRIPLPLAVDFPTSSELHRFLSIRACARGTGATSHTFSLACCTSTPLESHFSLAAAVRHDRLVADDYFRELLIQDGGHAGDVRTLVKPPGQAAAATVNCPAPAAPPDLFHYRRSPPASFW